MNESVRDAATDAILEGLERENAALRRDREKLEHLVAEHNELLHLTSFALNRVREAAYLLDEAGRLVYVNEEACRTLGYSDTELLQMSVSDIDPDWTADRCREAWPLLRRNGSLVIETMHRRKDGHLFPVQVHASYFEFSGKEYNLALARDVTERERAKLALRESEQRYRQVFDNVSDVLYLLEVTPQGRFRVLEVNPAGEQSLGIPRSELIGRYLDEAMPKEAAGLLDEKLRVCVQSGMACDDKLMLDLPSGRLHYHSMRFPVRDESGRIHRIVGIARDITKLRTTEFALRDSERAFRTLAENAPDAIVRYDRSCRRTYVNPEFVRVSGVEAEKLLGEPTDVLGAADEVTRLVHEKLRAIMESGVAAKFEINWTRYGARQCWYAHAVPECNADGVVQSVLTLFRDITERKEAELRLRESYELLRELTSRRETAREEERKRIAREMHDELGQQLTALRMGVSTLRLRFGHGNPEFVEHVQKILLLSDTTMQVVRDVVTSLRPAVLDAGIAAALEWLAIEFSQNGQTTCHLSVPEESPELAEERAIAMFRIVQEALTNVTRHARANRVFVTLEQTEHDCLLEVRDDGRGFDPVAVPRKSFGLAGMKERVLMLGGALDVSSSPGRGTSIKVRVPFGQHRSG